MKTEKEIKQKLNEIWLELLEEDDKNNYSASFCIGAIDVIKWILEDNQ